ncbi:MAG TPA: universal stress protein [Methanobacterium sp.]|nr:universal stress protein [Methanobacterium sp.]
MFKKILVPTDGSKPSERAGEYAISVADLNSADIILLNVINTDYLDALPQKDLSEKIDEGLREEGEEIVKKFKKKIEDEKCNGNCKNINWISIIRPGKPEDVILEVADDENVDQIIMGKSGKHNIERFLLGSTTERVVRGAKVSVTVIV